MPRLLPLFPLQLVAFPGIAVPLHIFEERYKTMVGNCERDGSEFGIVLAREEGIVNAGCTVMVEKVLERYPDGRFDLIARGQRRFMLVSLNQELDWLRGEVEYFEDDDFTTVTPQLREKAYSSWRRIQTAQTETGQDTHADEPEPEHPLLSFQLAQTVTDVNFQSAMLRNRSESDRLKQFVEFAGEYIPRTYYAAKMKRVSPTNGSGHRPAGL